MQMVDQLADNEKKKLDSISIFASIRFIYLKITTFESTFSTGSVTC